MKPRKSFKAVRNPVSSGVMFSFAGHSMVLATCNVTGGMATAHPTLGIISVFSIRSVYRETKPKQRFTKTKTNTIGPIGIWQ